MGGPIIFRRFIESGKVGWFFCERNVASNSEVNCSAASLDIWNVATNFESKCPVSIRLKGLNQIVVGHQRVHRNLYFPNQFTQATSPRSIHGLLSLEHHEAFCRNQNHRVLLTQSRLRMAYWRTRGKQKIKEAALSQ